jgi:tungstate transport system substrate-binding protein
MPSAVYFIKKFAIIFIVFGVCQAAAQSIVLASTTSTEQSGLFDFLLPEFSKKTGISVKVVALGTGQALDSARRGNADVVMVHDIPAEEKFVAEGFGLARRPVMYNDFLVVGPASDPAQIKGNDIAQALRKLSQANAKFVSRGDKSGTHSAELRYWALASGAHKSPPQSPQPPQYYACGCGMGAALNITYELSGYTITDRATWLNHRYKNQLAALVEGDQRLFNPYGVIVVNPAKHPHVKVKEAQAFADWLVSAEGQRSIAAYNIKGEQLFFPNAASKR